MSQGTGTVRPLRATYRLQLHDDFTFADAADQVPRLASLGISHLYLSPSLEAVPGSTHGYDVVDPTRIRASLGGEAGLRALAATAHEADLGLILDIVPNHVGLVSPVNPWWFDTLAHGPDGRFGRHLDVFWQPGAHGQPTLLVPELGERLPEALAGDALQLAHVPDDGRDPAWRIVYHDHAWPVRPGSLAAVGLVADDAGPTDAGFGSGPTDAGFGSGPTDAEVADAIAACRDDRNLFAALLDRQHYRLGYWRRANDELDHRRFFDIDTLGAVRIEDPAVFDDVHAAVLPLIADGTLDGLRIDHPDGLADPVGYFHRLRDAVGEHAYLVVEKILEHGERLRDDWPVDGTVGYELAGLVLGVHLDPAAGEVFDDLQATLTGAHFDRAHEADAAKRAALATLFGAERTRLAAALLAADPEAAADTGAADELLSELLVVWPVYRTYIRREDAGIDPDDRAIVESAVGHASARRPDLADGLASIRALLLRGDDPTDAGERFRVAFQQLTGPAIAKGLEDTVLYRDTRFVAVNEVGSDPGHLGASVADLHAANIEVAIARPRTMRLSTTHDTKRSADVRARLAVLSQRPDRWVHQALRLQSLAARHRTAAGPSPAHEHLAWQTAVGAWPITAERLADYLVKAAREGKQQTNWLTPDAAYEDALTAYAEALCTDPALVAAIDDIVGEVATDGWATSLAMVLMTLTGPGVPDVYQGDERWVLTLVDPDNRRPVDHDGLAAACRSLPDEPSTTVAAGVWASGADGGAKLWLTRQALRVRAQRSTSFGAAGGYEPLWAVGRHRGRVVAYRRGSDVIAVAPVQVAALGERAGARDWDDTTLTLPAGTWRDVLTGQAHAAGPTPMAELVASFPVALLVSEPTEPDEPTPRSDA